MPICLFTNLINIQNATLVVKARVEFIQHGDNLHGRALGTHGGKAHDVREQHSDIIKFTSGHRLTLPQFLCHIPRKY